MRSAARIAPSPSALAWLLDMKKRAKPVLAAMWTVLLVVIAALGQEAGTPNPPSSPNLPKRVRVSQGVMAHLIVEQVAPAYPPEARKKHVGGPVVIQIVIGRTGDVSETRVVSGDPLLVPSALEAVKQWRFKPYLLQGQPVEVESQVTMNYNLHH
jgi:periplasmic protein TonB